jgi:hypothetical protein
MGLLRKAAVSADRGDRGRAEPAPAPARKIPQRGPGLLQRSLRALQSARGPQAHPAAATAPASLSIELAERAPSEILPFKVETQARDENKTPRTGAVSPAAEKTRRLEDVLEEVLTAIAALQAGIELPSRLFTALAALLGLRKGALLLYDPVRLVYAPWAVLGYDQTTLHRMRIPLGANDAWNALANGSPLILSGAPAIAAFQQYFSSREISGVGRLILVPFIAEEKLIAVLLVTDIDSPLARDEDLVTCLARASEAGAPRVYKARAARVAVTGATGARPEPQGLRDEPTRFIASIGASRKTVLLLSLSLKTIQRASSRRMSTWIPSACTRTYPTSWVPSCPTWARCFRSGRAGSSSASRILKPPGSTSCSISSPSSCTGFSAETGRALTARTRACSAPLPGRQTARTWEPSSSHSPPDLSWSSSLQPGPGPPP